MIIRIFVIFHFKGESKVLQNFTSLLRVYYATKAVQAVEGVPAVTGSIVVVGALTRCALLPFVCDLKAV